LESSRIAELLAPFLGDSQFLTSEDLEHISTYIDMLTRWNARINLTAIRDPDEIVTRHFGESLFAARILFPDRKENCGRAALQSLPRACRGGRVEAEIADGALAPGSSDSSVPSRTTLADVGSGAGFPGVPIKLWHPDLPLTLIESNHKKATFLREVTRVLTLTDINILTSRAETLLDTSFDVVTLRAVERFESILPNAARLVSPGGRLVLLIGSTQLRLAQSILREIDGFAASHLVTEVVPRTRARVVGMADRSV
jgi:16S rRNA (guanine527-N7)-methyltransferase